MPTPSVVLDANVLYAIELTDLFSTFSVRSTPYLVAVDRSAMVRSRGVANTLDQAEEMLAEVKAGVIEPDAPEHS